jgi:hypothetical protein
LGGRNKRAAHRLDRLTPEGLRPVLDRLLDAMARVDEGKMDPKQATALAALAGAVCRVYEMASLEGDLQAALRRLEALERGRATG